MKILTGMIAGIIWGIIAIQNGFGDETSDFIKPFGTIFMNLLKMIAIPMIITSLIVGVASLSDINKLSRIGGRTIGIFILTTILAITIGSVCVNLLRPGDGIPDEIKKELMASYADKAASQSANAEKLANESPLQPLINLFPDNLTKAASDNANMLQIVIVALLVGIALILIPKEKSEPVIKVMDGLNDIVLKIVDFIMLLAPLGVFGLMSSVITEVAGNNPDKVIDLLMALGKYALVLLLGLVLHVLLVYLPMVKFLARKSPLWFLKKMRPVQLLAFSTSSSNATLPLNIENSDKNMGIKEEIGGFVLPLGATVNMDGTSMYQCIATVFIAQALNMDLSFSDQLMIIVTATLASIGSAGVPGAGMVMLVIVLNSVHVPAEGIALIMGIDRILDMCRTVVNVTGDTTVACVMARMENALEDRE
jgi:Na+/H+-dicarboxylate symporter